MEIFLVNVSSKRKKPTCELIRSLEYNKEADAYVSSEYNGSIAIRVKERKITKMFVSHYALSAKEERIPLRFDETSQVWFDSGDAANGRSPVGINQCGTFFFEGEDANGHIMFRSKDICITSSLLTESEFEQMKHDIAEIMDILASKQKGPVTAVHIEKKNYEEAGSMFSKIQHVKEVLLRIEKSPHELLVREERRMNTAKIKRSTVKTLLEKKMFPFKDKFTASVNTRSYHILEHRMIRWALVTINERAYQIHKQIETKLKKLEERIYTLEQSLEKVKYDSLSSFEREKIVNSINSDLSYGKQQAEVLEKNRHIWQEMMQEIDALLQLPFLDVGEEELQPTHLFTFSHTYSELYEELEELLQMKHTKQRTNSLEALQKTPELYEVWCLLSIIHTLIVDGGFISKSNPAKAIQSYVEKNKKLEGICFVLERPIYKQKNVIKKVVDNKFFYQTSKETLKVEIHYERVFSKTVRKYKPDFTFVFDTGTNKYTAYLDAKYKPMKTKEDWLDIVKEVSYKKYYEPLPVKPIASFLMHPNVPEDQTIDGWNAATNQKESFRHRLGSFHFKPNNKEALMKWVNMLLHYHLHYDSVCLHCGTHEAVMCEAFEETTWKKYYTCQNETCQAFWVKSICFNRVGGKYAQIDAHTSTSATLYKYTKHSTMNYHPETSSEWDVHCPVCNKKAQDRYVVK